MKVTGETYPDAVWIYLKNAYKSRLDVMDRMTWLDNPDFYVGDWMSEVRFGSDCNPHMKLRVTNGKLWVDTNDAPDPPEIRKKCREIQKRIHKEWKDYGFDVLEVME